MNVTLDINQIDLKNIYFLDSKKNIIVNGKFTRLMYTDSCFSMNGLYVNFPIFTPYTNQYSFVDNLSALNSDSKNLISFNINNPHNINIVKCISELEYRLLEYYRQEFASIDKDIIHKKITNNLSNQLYVGNIKLYKEKKTNIYYGNCINNYSRICPKPETNMNSVYASSRMENNNSKINVNYGMIQNSVYPNCNMENNNTTINNLEKEVDFIFPKKQHKIIYPPPGFSNITYSLSDSNLHAISNSYSNMNIFSPREKVGFSHMSYTITDGINSTFSHEQKRIVIVLKISGIWETKDEIGLTYKFLEMTSKY